MRRMRKMKKRVRPSVIFIYIVLIFWGLTTVYPFIWVLLNSFRKKGLILSDSFSIPAGKAFTLENYALAGERADFKNAYLNSFIISGSVTIGVMLLAGLAAYGMARYRFRGRNLLYSLTMAGNLCFAMVILMNFIRSVPIELEESAYMDGASVFQIFFRIIIPTAKSSFATVAIFSFLWSYNDLFTQSFFLRYPRDRAITGLLNEISSQAGVNYGLMAAAVVLVVIPVLVVYMFLQKNIMRGLTAGAVKG